MSEEKVLKNQEVANKPEKKKTNWIAKVFTKEYKFESVLLLVLAVIAMVLGFMVIVGDLVINKSVYFIGEYPMVFAWVLFILGALSLLLSVYPFFKPSFSEMKRVSWPSAAKLLKNVAIVFAYILILALFFMLTNALFSEVVELLNKLAGK